MRNIDANIKSALESEELRPFLLVSLSIDSNPITITDCDVPIAWNGELYEPRGFSPGSVSYSIGQVVDSVSFAVDNVDDFFTASFVGGDPRGTQVDIRMVLLDSDYQIIGSSADDNAILFIGYIDEWSLNEGKISIVLANAISQWNKKTLRLQSASCSWVEFKGDECRYSGAETECNRSYARCSALNNTANFGGERWLPSLDSQEIVWGKPYAPGLKRFL